MAYLSIPLMGFTREGVPGGRRVAQPFNSPDGIHLLVLCRSTWTYITFNSPDGIQHDIKWLKWLVKVIPFNSPDGIPACCLGP